MTLDEIRNNFCPFRPVEIEGGKGCSVSRARGTPEGFCGNYSPNRQNQWNNPNHGRPAGI
jgi:hypothetical protein